ncbi:MAG: azurin [Pseudoxanthomonas sp.]
MRVSAFALPLSLLAASLGFASAAHAENCTVSIGGDDKMQYDKTEINIPATCKQVSLTLTHTGKFAANMMGHNWVLAKTADVASISSDGMKSDMANDFLAAGDTRVIAHTKIIGGGESTTITFSTAKLSKDGDYTFFCSFPGHTGIMKGKFVFGRKPA